MDIGGALGTSLHPRDAGQVTLGEQVTLSRKTAAFGTVPGAYQVGVSVISEKRYGEGAIWSGVWLTSENGPEGWEKRIETNPHLPVHNTPDAHPSR